MKKLPTKHQIKKLTENTHWDFGNQILYDLCKNNFKHTKEDVILTKVLFIGRIYAAAVEGRKNKKQYTEINDNFYIKTVVPKFKASNLDGLLKKLRKFEKLKVDELYQLLECHYYLTSLLYQITKLEKRSFSSKYLHFHLPELFFIYDSRAVSALRHFSVKVPPVLETLVKAKNVDVVYASFFCKCFYLKEQIENEYSINLTNRQFDKLLIEFSNKKKSGI